MSGHSQFKNIMYRKGAQDAKKARVFAKLAREITVAAKSGLPKVCRKITLNAQLPKPHKLPVEQTSPQCAMKAFRQTKPLLLLKH